MSHNKVFNLQAVTVCVTQHGLKFVVVTIFLCHTTWLEIHWHSGKLNTTIIIIYCIFIHLHSLLIMQKNSLMFVCTVICFKVAFHNFYNTKSAADKCTLYSDRNLINRRNVSSDVDAAVDPCRKLFDLEVKARLIAAALHELGMSDILDTLRVNFPNQISLKLVTWRKRSICEKLPHAL